MKRRYRISDASQSSINHTHLIETLGGVVDDHRKSGVAHQQANAFSEGNLPIDAATTWRVVRSINREPTVGE